MKALSCYQPWATLLMLGIKSREFRDASYLDRAKYRLGPKAGERIVIHAAKRVIRRAEVQEALLALRRPEGAADWALDAAGAIPVLERALTAPGAFIYGAGLGICVLGAPYAVGDKFAWPVAQLEPFEQPIEQTGHPGFWEWAA